MGRANSKGVPVVPVAPLVHGAERTITAGQKQIIRREAGGTLHIKLKISSFIARACPKARSLAAQRSSSESSFDQTIPNP